MPNVSIHRPPKPIQRAKLGSSARTREGNDSRSASTKEWNSPLGVEFQD